MGPIHRRWNDNKQALTAFGVGAPCLPILLNCGPRPSKVWPGQARAAAEEYQELGPSACL